MKILIIRTHPSVINIDSYNVQEIGLAKAFAKKGHICDIVFFSRLDSYEEDYIIDEKRKIHIYWKKGKKFLNQGIYNFKELIQLANKYDYVQVNEYHQIASYMVIKNTKAYHVIYHGPYKNPKDIKGNIMEKIFDMFFLNNIKKMDTKIITKSILAEKYLRKKGLNNIETIGVGLDIERLEKKGFIKESKNTLLYIGEISKRRNTLFLLKILQEIKTVKKDIRLILIGKGKSNYIKKCRQFINKNQLQNNILYISSVQQKNISQYYLMADVFLFPSNYEIFGMVLLEAMYFKVPVISSENGGADTLIKSGKDGIIINNFDIKEWVQKTLLLLESNELANNIRNNAFYKIEKNFTWDSISEKFIHSYLKMNN